MKERDDSEGPMADAFVESHPNVAQDATLGWGTRHPAKYIGYDQ